MAKELKLSATRINMFLECKQRYWFNYVDHLPKMANPAFKLGLSCHEALEFAGRVWKEKGKFDKEDIEKILSVYDEMSVKEGLNDYGLHLLGKELTERKLINFKESAGNNIIGLEETFGMRTDNAVYTAEGVSLIGALDLVTEINDETLMIVDYKTSSTRPTPDKLKHDMQLSIYNLVANIKWPQYKRVILRLDFLKSVPMDTYRTPWEMEEFSRYLKIMHDEMKSLTKRDATPSLNMFCPWCDFKDYCTTYKKAYEKDNYSFEKAEKYDNEDLINDWSRIRHTKKILEQREKELTMLAMERIKKTGKNIDNGAEQMYIRQNSRVTYNAKTVFENVPNKEFVKMVTVNKKKVEDYINKKPSIRDAVENTANHNVTSPFLATKKLPKKKVK